MGVFLVMEPLFNDSVMMNMTIGIRSMMQRQIFLLVFSSILSLIRIVPEEIRILIRERKNAL